MNKKKSYREYIRITIFQKSIKVLVLTMSIIFLALFSVFYYTLVKNVKNENGNKNIDIIEVLSRSEDFLLNTEIKVIKDGDRFVLDRDNSIYESFYNAFDDISIRPKIYMFTVDNVNLLSIYSQLPSFMKVYDQNWGIYRELKDTDGIVTTIEVDNHDNEKTRYLKLGKTIKYDEEVVGYIFLTYNEKDMTKLLNKYITKTSITDEKGNFLFDQIGFEKKIYNKISDEYNHQSGITSLSKYTGYVDYIDIKDYGLVLYSGKSFDGLDELLLGAIGIFFIILFILSISLYYGTIGIAKIGTEHLDELTDAFIKAKNGDLEAYEFRSSYREFELIEDSYNTMLMSLQNQIETNKEISYILANTTISDLKAQFEPHFLFNTLETIKVMCKIDPQIAEKMILKLSKLLRYSLNYRFEDVRLEQDIENIENYLGILKFRFNKRFQYEIDIAENVKDCLIPRLIVQPLIENSAKYGMGENEILNIKVTAYEKDGKLFIICEDDGVGIDEDNLAKILNMMEIGQNTSQHFGIFNIHRMLVLKYGEEYGLKITSKENVKTKVQISLPYIDGDNKDV